MRLFFSINALLIGLWLTPMAWAQQASQTGPIDAAEGKQILSRFLGRWRVELTVGAPGEPPAKAAMTELRRLSQGGSFVVTEMATPPEMVMVLGFDEAAQDFPGVLMNATERWHLTGKWDAASSTMSFKGVGDDGRGYVGTHRFIAADRAAVSGRFTNKAGDVVLELASQQQRLAAKLIDGLTAKQLLARHAKAINANAAKTLNTRRAEGTVQVNDSFEMQTTILQKRPNLRYVRTTVAGDVVREEGYDGKTAWARNADQPARELEGVELDRVLRESRFEGHDLQAMFDSITYQGQQQIGDQPYHVLIGKMGNAKPTRLYMHPETYLIDQMRLPIPGDQMLTIRPSDWRAVDGLLIAHQLQIVGANEQGAFTLDIRFENVQHQVEINDQTFKMPQEQ